MLKYDTNICFIHHLSQTHEEWRPSTNERNTPTNADELYLYRKTDDVVSDARWIVETSSRFAHTAVDQAIVLRNWALGKRIAEEELGGEDRADYGEATVDKLSEKLTACFGKGFSRRRLYQFLSFYRLFPEIVHSASAQSGLNLSWTHYRTLLQVKDVNAREWYAR